MKAAGYSRYGKTCRVKRDMHRASKNVAGNASIAHIEAGFHHSIIVNVWSPIEQPNATITARIKMKMKTFLTIKLRISFSRFPFIPVDVGLVYSSDATLSGIVT